MHGLKSLCSKPALCLYRRTCRAQRHLAVRADPPSSSSAGTLTLAQPTQMTTEVKKSKFVATAWPVTTAPQALGLIQAASDPGASHNCWAYNIGSEYRSSDDGEPAGTAGRPILSAIQGEGLDGTCVLVTRYFGGTKLGAGGLVRAYGGAARECLRAAPKAVHVCMVRMQLSLPYKSLGAVYGQMERLGVERAEDEEYLEDGSVRVTVLVNADKESEFVTVVMDMTAGAIVPTRCASEA